MRLSLQHSTEREREREREGGVTHPNVSYKEKKPLSDTSIHLTEKYHDPKQ